MTSATSANVQAVAERGGMSEGGTDAAAMGEKIGADLGQFGAATLVAVRKTENINALVAGARQAGISTRHVADVNGATRTVEEILRPAQQRAVVLVKASHAWSLWRVAEQLLGTPA